MRGLSILGGIFLAFITLAGLELLVRFIPQAVIPLRLELSESSPTRVDAPTHIPIHLPPPVAEDEKGKMVKVLYPDKYLKWNGSSIPWSDDIGIYIKGPTQFRTVFQGADKKLLYDVKNTIDAHGRRISSIDQRNRNKNLIFLGCSFTYGRGVDDDETLPAQVARLQSVYRVYNYSFPSWGPNNLDRLIHRDDFATDLVKTAGGKAIYVFIDDHIPRAVGSLDVYRRAPVFTPKAPSYYLDTAGNLRYQGTMADRGWIHYLYSFLAKSALLHHFRVDIPIPKKSHIQLVAALIDDMRKALKEKTGADLVVAILPRSQSARYLIPILDEKGIASLDYSNVEEGEYVTGQAWLQDMHPTAAYYNFLAKQMVTDLNLNE